MKLYKNIAGLLATALITATLCGCAENGKGVEHARYDEEEASITYFSNKADAINLIAIEASLHDFMDKHPNIEVNYEGLKGAEYWATLEKRAASGNLDDVMIIDHDHFLDFRSKNMLADLSDLSTVSDYADLSKNKFTEDDGSVYFLPAAITGYGFFVNTDLLEEHGQKIPENLKELTEVCDYFVSKNITPIITNKDYALRRLIIAKGFAPLYADENSAQMIQKLNTGEEDVAEVLRPGIEMVRMMLDKGWMDVDTIKDIAQSTDELSIFAEGNYPFMITGGWTSVRVAAKDPQFTYEVYPFPVLDDGSVLSVQIDTCIAANANTPHLDAVKKLVEHLTQKDVIWDYCESQDSFTPLKTEKRVPSDITIAPMVEHLKNGAIVIDSDYSLEIPLYSVLNKCAGDLLKGAATDEVVSIIRDSLSK